MALGRCAGCGLVDSASVVAEHTRLCDEFRELYIRDPAAALPPEDEYKRFAADDRAGVRAVRKAAAVAEADRRRAEQDTRWRTPPDILEEL